jgi:hypothetical protein
MAHSAGLHIRPTATVRRGAAARSVLDYWPGPTIKAARSAYSRAAYGPRCRARASGRSSFSSRAARRCGAVPADSPVADVEKCRPG